MRLSRLPLNLFFLILCILYQDDIQTNEDSTNVIKWLNLLYDTSFLKVCLDPHLQSTLKVVASIVENHLKSQQMEVEVLSMIE